MKTKKLGMELPGRINRGRLMGRYVDVVREDMQVVGVTEGCGRRGN